jgi:hypothetical protein
VIILLVVVLVATVEEIGVGTVVIEVVVLVFEQPADNPIIKPMMIMLAKILFNCSLHLKHDIMLRNFSFNL